MCKKIAILGQTSSGKSDFAVEIAKEINGEIVSADSRQVYKGMNLGTGKITKKEMQGIPHYLLDIYSPKKIFTVSEFKQKAEKAISDIAKRKKTPIICGGTGFYIDTLLNNSTLPGVPPNKMLRQELAKKTTLELFEMLKKLDPKRAENIDSKNKVRLVRAIEIAKALGKVPFLSTAGSPTSDSSDILKIGLALPPEILKERIYNRLISRIKKGMIKEIENLHKNGVSWKRLRELGLEYRYVSMYLEGILSKEEMIEKLNSEIWKYAKRQKTWFKRDKSIVWIDPRKKTAQSGIIKQVKKFLK